MEILFKTGNIEVANIALSARPPFTQSPFPVGNRLRSPISKRRFCWRALSVFHDEILYCSVRTLSIFGDVSYEREYKFIESHHFYFEVLKSVLFVLKQRFIKNSLFFSDFCDKIWLTAVSMIILALLSSLL